jgi:hypothetical protein
LRFEPELIEPFGRQLSLLAMLGMYRTLEAVRPNGAEARPDHVVESLDEQLEPCARGCRVLAEHVEDERLAQNGGRLGEGERHLCAQVAALARQDAVNGVADLVREDERAAPGPGVRDQDVRIGPGSGNEQ